MHSQTSSMSLKPALPLDSHTIIVSVHGVSVHERGQGLRPHPLGPQADELPFPLLVTHVPNWRQASTSSLKKLGGEPEILGLKRDHLPSSRIGPRGFQSFWQNRDNQWSRENWHWKLSVWKTGQPLLAAELIIMQIYANKLCLECCWEAAFSR